MKHPVAILACPACHRRGLSVIVVIVFITVFITALVVQCRSVALEYFDSCAFPSHAARAPAAPVMLEETSSTSGRTSRVPGMSATARKGQKWIAEKHLHSTWEICRSNRLDVKRPNPQRKADSAIFFSKSSHSPLCQSPSPRICALRLLTALRAGPPFSWGVTSGGPPGGRSLSKDGTHADSARRIFDV